MIRLDTNQNPSSCLAELNNLSIKIEYFCPVLCSHLPKSNSRTEASMFLIKQVITGSCNKTNIVKVFILKMANLVNIQF